MPTMFDVNVIIINSVFMAVLCIDDILWSTLNEAECVTLLSHKVENTERLIFFMYTNAHFVYIDFILWYIAHINAESLESKWHT